jgi:hypothetical protein
VVFEGGLAQFGALVAAERGRGIGHGIRSPGRRDGRRPLVLGR